MWRWMIVALVAANGLFWIWGHDGLRALGLGATDISEPARVKDQIQPEAMRVTPQTVPLENNIKSGSGVTILPPAEPETPQTKGGTPAPVAAVPAVVPPNPTFKGKQP
jgi:hypothetical protein